MSIALATCGYIVDPPASSPAPAAPSGRASVNTTPYAPSGTAMRLNPSPAAPRARALDTAPNIVPEAPRARATVGTAPLAPVGRAVDTTPNPPPSTPGGAHAEDV